VVTLLVTPAQSVSLTLAAFEGKIQLVLRNSGDRQTSPTAGRELRELYGQTDTRAPVVAAAEHKRTAAAPKAVPAVPAAAPPVETMILYRGAVKSVETFPAAARR
jgi:Flp pilus assembly protein CpaB